jgi:hypothetical protein
MKDFYRSACLSGTPVPLFSQPWWLDAVAGDQSWDVALVERDGKLLASMPYVRRRRLGFDFSTQPPLTQALGPWLRPSGAKSAKSLSQQKDLMEALIGQLPPFDHFSQNWSPGQTNWLPFYWKGFQQTTRYTYALADLGNEELLWKGLNHNIRTDIRKASERFSLRVRDDLGLAAFLDLNRKVFARQGKALPYPESLVHRLDQACESRGCRKILIAEDPQGRAHAGVYLVWDENSAFYLMGGGDPELRGSGATSLCMWEAIRHSATVTRRFDFEGSMLEPVERFFRAFGAEQVAYFQVRRTNSKLLRAAEFLRSISRAG